MKMKTKIALVAVAVALFGAVDPAACQSLDTSSYPKPTGQPSMLDYAQQFNQIELQKLEIQRQRMQLDQHRSEADLGPKVNGLIVVAIGTMSVAPLCGYKLVKHGVAKLGHRIGVETTTIGPAIIEAMNLYNSVPYNPSLLIPEVTRGVNTALDAARVASQNKAQYCRTLAPMLLSYGTIER
jgi:hypothetical protein